MLAGYKVVKPQGVCTVETIGWPSDTPSPIKAYHELYYNMAMVQVSYRSSAPQLSIGDSADDCGTHRTPMATGASSFPLLWTRSRSRLLGVRPRTTARRYLVAPTPWAEGGLPSSFV